MATAAELQKSVDSLRLQGKISKETYIRWTKELKSSDAGRVRMSTAAIGEAVEMARMIPEGSFGFPQTLTDEQVDSIMSELKSNVNSLR